MTIQNKLRKGDTVAVKCVKFSTAMHGATTRYEYWRIGTVVTAKRNGLAEKVECGTGIIHCDSVSTTVFPILDSARNAAAKTLKGNEYETGEAIKAAIVAACK